MMGRTKAEAPVDLTTATEEVAATFAPLPPIEEATGAEQVSEPKAIEPTSPTAPRPESPDGFVLDEWGLPLVGPVRVAVLDRMGRTDPNTDPTGWERTPAPAAPQE